MTPSESDDLHLHYQSLDGSLNWLAHTTHPDISTVVSLLVLNLSSYGHFEAACYVVKYLSNTKKLGIYFTSTKRSIRSVSIGPNNVLPKAFNIHKLKRMESGKT
jgi:hypothetical protein